MCKAEYVLGTPEAILLCLSLALTHLTSELFSRFSLYWCLFHHPSQVSYGYELSVKN